MIIVSAAAFESAPLCAALAARESVATVVCGVGVIAAATAGQRVRSLCRGREVLFIGTCGTFGAFEQIALCRAQTLHWSPTCARVGLSYAVDKTPPLALDPRSRYDDLPVAEVFCAPNVSLINNLPAAAPAGMLYVENVEAYAFLAALHTAARVVDVLLAVTNAVGRDAARQWRQHHSAAAELTAAYVKRRRFTHHTT